MQCCDIFCMVCACKKMSRVRTLLKLVPELVACELSGNLLMMTLEQVTTCLRPSYNHQSRQLRPCYIHLSRQLRPSDDRLLSVKEVTDDSDDPTDDK